MSEQDQSLFPEETPLELSTDDIVDEASEDEAVEAGAAEAPAEPAPESTGKQASADRTIGEAAKELGVATHVLRFWENKFDQIEPLRRGNRRFYRPADMETLHRIQALLKQDGMTIAGAKAKLKGEPKSAKSPLSSAYKAELLDELKALRGELA